MLSSLRFSRIVFIASFAAAATNIASYALWINAGVTLSISIRASLMLAADHPGLWGVGYLLQAFAFILWALIPFAIGNKFRGLAPGLSQLVVVVGGFGFAWRALTDFARAGSIEYLGQMYASNDPLLRALAEQMAAWTQLWTFGAVWEFMGNGLAFGAFPLIVGLLFVAARKRALGWTVALLGGLSMLSFVGTAFYYISGIRSGIDLILTPGIVAIAAAPLWLALFAWLADRES
ncbi:MAG: hypothetical protein FJ030_06025 [Chloroflexi bacterium]|nr:hypothetical protein [Chloroflexota bacterium]